MKMKWILFSRDKYYYSIVKGNAYTEKYQLSLVVICGKHISFYKSVSVSTIWSGSSVIRTRPHSGFIRSFPRVSPQKL